MDVAMVFDEERQMSMIWKGNQKPERSVLYRCGDIAGRISRSERWSMEAIPRWE